MVGDMRDDAELTRSHGGVPVLLSPIARTPRAGVLAQGVPLFEDGNMSPHPPEQKSIMRLTRPSSPVVAAVLLSLSALAPLAGCSRTLTYDPERAAQVSQQERDSYECERDSAATRPYSGRTS